MLWSGAHRAGRAVSGDQADSHMTKTLRIARNPHSKIHVKHHRHISRP